MNYKRILTIQDISCVGQCSLTVALPILSACGKETCVLPSAVLSTQTGGFTGYTFRDLTEDIPSIAKHWQKEGILFDAVYTGYLGSTKQIDYVADIFNTLLVKDGVKIVDPAMADNGKLYYGFDEEYVAAMKTLCQKADIILPNITEACFITGIEYKEKYNEEYIDSILSSLEKSGMKTVILTGVGYENEYTGVVVFSHGEKKYYRHRRLAVGSHGTGDVYASAFTGAFVSGIDEYKAARIAADYTLKCIENTSGDEKHWYGVKFEIALPELVKAIEEATKQ